MKISASLVLLVACAGSGAHADRGGQPHEAGGPSGAAGGGDSAEQKGPQASEEMPADPETFTPEEAREICAALIRKTRPCKTLYLTQLLRTRAKYDQPPGIAARYEAEGEDALLPIASEEFDVDFSEEGVAKRCDALLAKPAADRDSVVAREHPCLAVADDCTAYVACNMDALEKKWATPKPAGSSGRREAVVVGDDAGE